MIQDSFNVLGGLMMSVSMGIGFLLMPIFLAVAYGALMMFRKKPRQNHHGFPGAQPT